ncbi:MAG: AbrB/MazE/SpoVT family DNA-binding domain-containing protein [Candidatus Aminicenantes bacterium]|nr:AbrB/MazE/SpoVT family DNA-binding domain-containing protein [Candidatus Aminicenantes bacterium]
MEERFELEREERRTKMLTENIDYDIVLRKYIDGDFVMQTVTVSPKYQVVIPRDVRRSLKIKPGQKLRVIEHEGRIELLPAEEVADLKGFLKGIDTSLEREEDRL